MGQSGTCVAGLQRGYRTAQGGRRKDMKHAAEAQGKQEQAVMRWRVRSTAKGGRHRRRQGRWWWLRGGELSTRQMGVGAAVGGQG